MSANKYDLVVLGSGPGGEGAAMQAVKSGLTVAVVDAQGMVGGNCTHWGTIPSKSLRQTIEHLNTLKKHPLLQSIVGKLDVSYPQLLKQAERSIEMQVQVRQGFYDRNDVTVYHGIGKFKDPHTLIVSYADGAQETLVADSFVIAVGAHPYHPPDIDFTHPRIRDSNTILTLDSTPRSMIIYGAGVIGCEYASVFCNLGLRVNLINTRDRLLAFLDTEICDALSYHMRDEGVIIRHEEVYDKVEPLDDGVVLHLKSGKKIKADVLLWANGRTGNTADLGLEDLSLEADSRGQLTINDSYQTALDHVYAVGDVIGFPSLASAAYNQGRFAATHLINKGAEYRLVENNPTGIYTSPEISSIGKTEQELTAESVPYEVGRAIFRNLARAQIVGVTVGILKILFHRDTQDVLGIHCFGYQAAEIIHIGQVAMSHPETSNLSYFINTTFNYPTMAEAYRVAALNGQNRLF